MTWNKLALKLLITVAALLVGAWLVANLFAAKREARLEAEFPPSGQFIKVNGRKVHYRQFGTGPDLVMLHGASGSLRDMLYDGLAESLGARYRVTIFDRPGMGYSDRAAGPYDRIFTDQGESPTLQARILHDAATKIGVKNPIVMGQSFGGQVAISWGLDYQDDTSALVLVAAVSAPWSTDLSWLYRVLGTGFLGGYLAPFVTTFAPQSLIDDSVDGVFSPQPAPQNYAVDVAAKLAIRRSTIRANARQVNNLLPQTRLLFDQLPRLTLPVEMIHGDADPVVPIDVHSLRSVDRFANANLQIEPGIGHMPHHVRRAQTIAAIDRAAQRAGLH